MQLLFPSVTVCWIIYTDSSLIFRGKFDTQRPTPPVLTMGFIVEKLIPHQLQKTPSSWTQPALRLQLISTCWLMEPHSFNTCNFLMDHSEKKPLSPTLHLSVFHSLCSRRNLFLQWNSLSFCLLDGLLSFPFLCLVSLFTFLSPFCLNDSEFKRFVSKERRKYQVILPIVCPHLRYFPPALLKGHSSKISAFNNLWSFFSSFGYHFYLPAE